MVSTMNDIFLYQHTDHIQLLSEDRPSFWVSGMRALHWCMMGVTIPLLVCEVAVSQLCKSLITLVDGFHTLFILMCMALPPLQTAGLIKPPPSSLDSLASPPHASPSAAAPPPTPPAGSSIEPSPGATNGSSTPNEPPAPRHNLEAASPFNSHQLCFPEVSPPALDCGVSYAHSRVQAVGAFISSLLLASLCTSYLMEIISFSLDPHPVQRPLLLVVVGALSLLHKMLVLRLNWDQLQEDRARARGQPETESHLEVNHKVLAEEKETKGLAEPGRVLDDVGQAAVNDSLHNGALVLCNPGTSSIPDAVSQTPQQQPEVHLRAADSQNASKTFPVCKSSCHTESPVPSSQWPVWLLSFLLVIQGLLSSLLALVNSLVMLLVGPQCLHSSGACSLLVYLDPGLSLLAVITLITASMPQVHRYGLLLLQATPPHICVSDLGRRIASVSGVQAVHDLHVWQLTESFTVASVHVLCHAGFPAHRCADLMSGVTKVLQSVGVSCCTVQPEFASCSGCSAGSGGDASPVVHREDPSLPPVLACSLACGKACTGNRSYDKSLLAPPTGETKEEPQTLVIENTFL